MTTENDPPTIRKCWKILTNKSAKWNDIGIILDIPYNYREQLRTDIIKNPSAKLEDVLIKWFEQNSPVTWEMFRNALEELEYKDCIEELKLIA